jgi:hypothetical protein
MVRSNACPSRPHSFSPHLFECVALAHAWWSTGCLVAWVPVRADRLGTESSVASKLLLVACLVHTDYLSTCFCMASCCPVSSQVLRGLFCCRGLEICTNMYYVLLMIAIYLSNISGLVCLGLLLPSLWLVSWGGGASGHNVRGGGGRVDDQQMLALCVHQDGHVWKVLCIMDICVMVLCV